MSGPVLYKTSLCHLNGFPHGSNIGSTEYNNIGEKPTVILYTYINRHAGTPEKNSKNKTDNVVHHHTW